jgi:hypothetical protein
MPAASRIGLNPSLRDPISQMGYNPLDTKDGTKVTRK